QHDSFPSSSQQPDKRSRLLYAGCHRISKQFSFRFLSVIVRATDFDNGLDISTPHQRFTCVRLRLPYLPNYIRLFFNAHDNDSLSMPLEGVCIHLLQSECGGPTTISCEVTQTILSLRDNTVCSRHTLQTVQPRCGVLLRLVSPFCKCSHTVDTMTAGPPLAQK